MLKGSCWLHVDGAEPFLFEAGDYVLLPATPGFRMGSNLAALERPVVHIKPTDNGAERLTWIARAVSEESAASRPGGDAILTRLVEIRLIEAQRRRPAPGGEVTPLTGLLAGLADSRMSAALRLVHDDVARRWTIEELASQIGMSRAAFAARFTQVLGVPPMEYVLRWRMALAKEMLWHGGLSLGEVAHAIGYQSASAFSTAFNRSVGMSPSSFARTGRVNP